MALRTQVDEALAAAGLARRVKMAVSSFWSAAFLAAQSDLIVTVPGRFAAVSRQALDLVVLPLPLDLPAINLSMIWEDAAHDDPAHVWMRGVVLAAFAAGDRRRPPR
jgi:DNA-binding transcriptional LysR family regulator